MLLNFLSVVVTGVKLIFILPRLYVELCKCRCLATGEGTLSRNWTHKLFNASRMLKPLSRKNSSWAARLLDWVLLHVKCPDSTVGSTMWFSFNIIYERWIGVGCTHGGMTLLLVMVVFLGPRLGFRLQRLNSSFSFSRWTSEKEL